MTRICLTLAVTTLAAPLIADETRELGAHEHGRSALNIAIEGGEVAMDLRAPGADIVGFEHAAASDADKQAIEAAIAALSDPLSLFVVPEAAGCTVSSAEAVLESHAAHDEDHDHDHEEGHDHDDEHAEEHGSGHSEFHAEYALSCSAPDALTEITFAFFELFPNAREVEVQLVSDAGAQSFDVDRDAPVLRLGD